ncbi:MAG: hypothetical protein WDN01_15805 [Rhizomicrobium sp.]
MLFFRDRRAAAGAIVVGAVFSHWLLDLVVHVADLPLLGDSFKVGFGLWRHVWISVPLEIAILIAGAALYARAVPSRGVAGDRWLWVFVAAMIGVQTFGTFGPAPESGLAEAHTALGAYQVLAGMAALVDWARGTVGTRTAAPAPTLAPAR